MELVFEAPGKVRLERDASRKLYVAQWQVLCGPHYREACQAMLDDARRHGIAVYVSDPHAARDIQSRDDLLFAATVVNELIALGCRRFIVVKAQSAVTQMSTNRMGKVVDGTGTQRQVVATLEDALALARS